MDGATDEHGNIALERSECLALLGSVAMGRLVHTANALPAVWPLNFVLLPDAVYLLTSRGSPAWQAADAGAVVAFQADDVDVQGRYGWSVVVIGSTSLVSDPVSLRRLRDVVPPPWAQQLRASGLAQVCEEVVRIPLELVDGRRAGAAVQVPHDRPVPTAR